ncbi:MAG: diguanylate cyclase [Gammaproteobacteria bacterium]|nr:diguanylate cyclase [Gammaproteobacteria bacterium]
MTSAISGEDWIPILFLSGHTEDDYIQRALESGADVYLRKPINAVELTGQIRAMSCIADHITLSVGLATSKGTSRLSPDAFIQRADDALYQAKGKGRNLIVVAP